MIQLAKNNVYLHEFNVLMENTVYLPLVSGLLSSYARSISTIAQHYNIMPFIFTRKDIKEILPVYQSPKIAAFSTSMWNEQLNLRLAAQIKRLYPDCLIVFGGPQVPSASDSYFAQNPFIDITVRGYGEAIFSKILETFIDTRDFSSIPNASWFDEKTKSVIHNECVAAYEVLPDISVIPSPYLSGEYDYLFNGRGDIKYQSIIETNRGCPYSCTYCYWGKGETNKRIQFYDLKRVANEIVWCAEHKIEYLFNADANFGIAERDIEIAEILVETRRKYGFPNKFRTCYTKNAENRVVEISDMLRAGGLEKGITLSFQSVDLEVMKNVKRKNIDLPRYKELIAQLTRKNIPIYTELILGMPGETIDTWTNGINSIYSSGFRGQLFIYPCEVYPNVEMNDPAYIKKFGINTIRIKMTEAHGIPHKVNDIHEYQNIVCGTNSMSIDDWCAMLVFSWLTMLLLSMKAALFIIEYLHVRYGIKHTDFVGYLLAKHSTHGSSGDSLIAREINSLVVHVKDILNGAGRCSILPEFGNIYWDQEEVGFLRISKELEKFYSEMTVEVVNFLASLNLPVNSTELEDIILYQQSRMPRLIIGGDRNNIVAFRHNIPEFFDSILAGKPVAIVENPQKLSVNLKGYKDAADFAVNVVMIVRKSDNILQLLV
jgi:putative methyltransferase